MFFMTFPTILGRCPHSRSLRVFGSWDKSLSTPSYSRIRQECTLFELSVNDPTPDRFEWGRHRSYVKAQINRTRIKRDKQLIRSFSCESFFFQTTCRPQLDVDSVYIAFWSCTRRCLLPRLTSNQIIWEFRSRIDEITRLSHLDRDFTYS